MKGRFSVLQYLGASLIFLSVGILGFLEIRAKWSQRENAELTEQIAGLLPKKTVGSPADYTEAEMPVLQIDGVDYVCLLEVPHLGIVLPVQNSWESPMISSRPGRFWGSIYDGTCILGGSNQEGQFAFCSRLDVGDDIVITDMQGVEFRCCVERIDRSQSADFEQLYHADYPLTLFVREKYESRYIVVRCDWAYL